MTTKPEMTDSELIEKCKEIISGMNLFAYEQSKFTDLLTRFEKLVKENEQLKDALNQIANAQLPFNEIEAFTLIDKTKTIANNVLTPNLPKPQKDE